MVPRHSTRRYAAGIVVALLASSALSTAGADDTPVDQATPSTGGGYALPLPHDFGAADAAGRAAGREQSNQMSPGNPATVAPSAVSPRASLTDRVFATQYVPNTPGSVEVAVPDKCAKFAALGLKDSSCPVGYAGLDYRVVVQRANGQSATLPVKDVGPWNIDDNYWDPPAGPRPRRLFTDVPQGTPEAQAAFYGGYNTVPNCNDLNGQPSGHPGPADQFGRCVLNPAGIDLSVDAAQLLGMGPGQNEWVTVSFLWESTTQGNWLVGSDGGIFTFGTAGFYGSMGGTRLNAPVVGMARTPDAKGYWLVASDGGIFTFGDAGFYGSTGNVALNKPVVGMASTPDGHGYWLVASDGGVFTFGDAAFHGSTGNVALNKPIVGMAPGQATGGYWLVAADGGIFSFNAPFLGSTGAMVLNKPIVGMAATPDAGGYRLVASDGGIFTFGDAGFYGSTGNIALNKPVVGMGPSQSGHGYWLAASDGGTFNFGDAGFVGSMGGSPLNKPVVGLATVG